MGNVVALSAALLLLSPAIAGAADKVKNWEAFSAARRAECVGGPGEVESPVEIAVGAHKYRLEGHRLKETTSDADATLKIGVLSATKDDREDTIAAIRAMIARFEKRGVDIILANGDLATDEFEMEAVFPILAEAKALVILLIGNTESCGSFNKIAGEVFAKHPHVVNGNWVRRIELDDSTIITVPGYYDRKFTHTGGASTYDPEDLAVLEKLIRDAPEPRVLVSHGPPRMKGKNGVDVLSDGSNVGDPAMSELLKTEKLRFGIFGHILEAGGRGSDLTGTKKLAQKTWHPDLYVNAGTLNPDPWTMLDGTTSYGIAMYLEIEAKRARYEVERLPAPKSD